MTFTKRDLSRESLGKVGLTKTMRVIAENKAFKWEINIKYSFLKIHVLEN